MLRMISSRKGLCFDEPIGVNLGEVALILGFQYHSCSTVRLVTDNQINQLHVYTRQWPPLPRQCSSRLRR